LKTPATASLSPKTPAAPKHLSAEARRWWRSICNEYAITDKAGLLLLQTALEAFCRMRDAQKIIAEHGSMILDRHEQLKINPLIAAERDARSAMLQSLKALNLDLEPLKDAPGRPPGGIGL
jgi:P27 family predicted phage terminase small subunit